MRPSNKHTHDYQLGAASKSAMPSLSCSSKSKPKTACNCKYVNKLQFDRNIQILMGDNLHKILLFDSQTKTLRRQEILIILSKQRNISMLQT